jgi:hypothetical protein
MVIELHAERPRNRVSIPKASTDSSTVSRPVLGSMQLANGSGNCFSKDKESLPHHSCPSATTTLTGKPEQRIRV